MYGLVALGWVCDSIIITAASRSITPLHRFLLRFMLIPPLHHRLMCFFPYFTIFEGWRSSPRLGYSCCLVALDCTNTEIVAIAQTNIDVSSELERFVTVRDAQGITGAI